MPDTPPNPDTPPTPDPDQPGPEPAPGPAPTPDPAEEPESGPAPGRPTGRARTRREPPPKPPGLREQILLTRDAVRRVIDAHVALAKAELEPIVANVKTAATLAAMALGIAIFALLLVSIGTPLFLGEWWFGSMGWGILHGSLLAVAIIAACISLILVDDAGVLARSIVLSLVVGILFSIVFGLSLTNQGWQALTDQLNLGLPVEVRLLGVAAAVSAIVGAFLGAIVGAWRGAGRSFVNGLVFGTLLGLLVGVFTAISFGWQTGIAVGIAGALVAFAALVLSGLARNGVDMEAFKARFYPEQTIVTTKETLEWLQSQGPKGPKP
jgi:MFS family permease